MAKEEKPKEFPCPCYTQFAGKSGTCAVIKYPRQEGCSTGSCPYGGDVKQCLKQSSETMQETLVDILAMHIQSRKDEAAYFERLLT